MKTLTKQILCKYLPWKIRVKVEDDDVYILSFAPQTNRIIYEDCYGILDSDIKYIKLYVRPLSDLTNPIIVKGYNDDKEFVPMVELAKKDMPSEEWMDDTTSFETFILNDYEHTTYYVYNKDLGRLAFNGRKIYYEDEDYNTSPSGNIELFDLLHQWHFDLYNGIKDGWAIDINTLNK